MSHAGKKPDSRDSARLAVHWSVVNTDTKFVARSSELSRMKLSASHPEAFLVAQREQAVLRSQAQAAAEEEARRQQVCFVRFVNTFFEPTTRP